MLIREAHNAVAHMSMNAKVAEVRKLYWILQIQQGVRKVLRNCITCKKVQGKSYGASTIPPLPDFRVQSPRAIQMELVNNLSCHSFLLAFHKICNRRAFPSLVLSDNGTTFVAVAGSLRNIAVSREVQQHLLDMKCSCNSFLLEHLGNMGTTYRISEKLSEKSFWSSSSNS